MSKHGYEQTSVGDIRSILSNPPYNYAPEDLRDSEGKPLNKKALVNMILEDNKTLEESGKAEEVVSVDVSAEEIAEVHAAEEGDELTDLFEDAEEVTEEIKVCGDPIEEADAEEEVPPPFNSAQWSDYVFRQFEEDELEDGTSPVCDALRRVVGELIGPILSREIVHVTPGVRENNGTATVGRRIRVKVANPAHPAYGEILIEEEIADCGRQNTDHPFVNHAPATASTRAEGRAYRKLLGLSRVLAAEEKSKAAEEAHEDFEVDNSAIAPEQVNVIDMLCKRLNISVLEYINAGKAHYKYLEQISGNAAIKMIKHLNSVQRDVSKKPKGLGAYSESWRDANKTVFEKELSGE